MKRTLIKEIADHLPYEIARLLDGATLYDSSSSPDARVWLIDRDGGCFLKRNAVGRLKKEAEMTAYFHKKGLASEVLYYASEGDYDYLLTSRLKGEDATDRRSLAEPRRLAVLLGESLRALHEGDFSDCPIPDHTSSYLALAKENCEKGLFDPSYAETYGIKTAKEAREILSSGQGSLRREVLLHGDFCLPNVILSDFSLSGYIDLGNGGVGDRHVDLFWGIWSLTYNLKTDAYREVFIDAYGRELLDFDRLKTVAAAETFG